MRTLSIDIETYSSHDIKDGGVYKYVEAPDFQILLLAYAFDDEPVQIVDLASGEELPREVMSALFVPDVMKQAFNASFERTCINRSLDFSGGFAGHPSHWDCTMVRCAMLGLPMSLDKAAEVLKLPVQKMKEGKTLINYFCKPCKPTKTNGGRLRNLPHHNPEKWELFKRYCAMDVEVERSIRTKLSFFTPSEDERSLWILDQLINDRGVRMDKKLISNAIRIDADYRERLMQEAVNLTGLVNPNSVSQLIGWMSEATGEAVTDMTKKNVPVLLDNAPNDTVRRVLEIRQELSKTSVKKYMAMAKGVCADGRLRGLLQYYGATRTGRWAGRNVQVQNLPRNEIKDLDAAREFVLSGDSDAIEVLWGNVPDTLSQLIRTAFTASKDSQLLVSDFSAIEAVVLAWLSGEEWRMEVFRTHGKIYEASASKMFKVPLESIDKKSPLRQKGKLSELALGYQGGPNALISMGALNMGVKEDELKPLVDAWRGANKKIAALWYAMNDAAIATIETGKPHSANRYLSFSMKKGMLVMHLPSGRQLYYPHARTRDGRFGNSVIVYKGTHQQTRQWVDIDTYGGSLVENATQAIARDCLALTLLRLDAAGFDTVMHIHDEVVIDLPGSEEYAEQQLPVVQAIMSEPIPWAEGLPLKAEGYVTRYYKKD